MIGTPTESSLSGVDIVTLGAADVPAMLAADRTDKTRPSAPGPRARHFFSASVSTAELVAMTGERMKPGNYTEMTAVCVHPDHRGRGYAQALLSAVARQSWRGAKFPSCTSSQQCLGDRALTAARAWRSAAVCTSRCCRSRSKLTLWDLSIP